MSDQKITDEFLKLNDRINQLEANEKILATKCEAVQNQLNDLNEMIERRPEHTTRHHLGS